MNHYEIAAGYHAAGFNCCQSVVAAFADITGLTEQESMNLGSGFGAGAGTGELCGAITGAVMVLNLKHPTDMTDPYGSKKVGMALSKELQKRFSERLGALRCHDLLKLPITEEKLPEAAKKLQLSKHCDIMILTAVEIVEELLAQEA